MANERPALVLSLTALLLAAGTAGAAPASASSPARASRPPPKRPVPAYDGRPELTTAGDVARGVARVILWPIYAVVNYGLRKPIGFAVRTAEHSRTARRVFRYIFLGPPAPTLSIYPIAFYDFGFQSSIGLRMAWVKGFVSPGSRYTLKLAFGGPNWRRADSNVRLELPGGVRVTGDFGMGRRPDQIFHGLGSRSPQAARARYTLDRTELTLGAGWPVLSAYAGVSTVIATESNYSNEPSIQDQLAAGRIAEVPAGYNELLLIQRIGARLALDTRGGVRTRSGARLDVRIERAHEDDLGAWTRVEGVLGGALRLDPVGEYKLDLRLRVELVEADAGATVPFMELATFGGSRDLRGFASGRGRGASALALTLDYQWPVAAWLDTTLYAGVGNVFGENLAGFYAGKLRGSIGTGLALTNLSAARQVELWTALGTDPLDDGFNFSSFRLVLGYSYDY